MSDPLALARSPIRPPEPLTVLAGWEVSGRRAAGELTLTDCTPLTKVQLKASITGPVAAELGVPFGRRAQERGRRPGSGFRSWRVAADRPARPGR